jgi:hypothetical protein
MEFINKLKSINNTKNMNDDISNVDKFIKYLNQLILEHKDYVYSALENKVKDNNRESTVNIITTHVIDKEYIKGMTVFFDRDSNNIKYKNKIISDICSTKEYNGFKIGVSDSTIYYNSATITLYKSLGLDTIPKYEVTVFFEVDLN